MPESNGGRRLHPRLRVVRNGDRSVNALRSDSSTTVVCALPSTARAGGVLTAPALAASSPDDLASMRGKVTAPKARLPRRRKIEEQPKPDRAYVNVLIELYPERSGVSAAAYESARKRLDGKLRSEIAKASNDGISVGLLLRRNFVSATVPVSMLDSLERNPAIAFVHPVDSLKLDAPATKPAEAPLARSIGRAATHGRGKGALIGIIDVGGFDFAHPDFLDDKGKTRFLAIWD
jgi:hypothetical protein